MKYFLKQIQEKRVTKVTLDQEEHQEHRFQDYKGQKETQVISALFFLTIFENVTQTELFWNFDSNKWANNQLILVSNSDHVSYTYCVQRSSRLQVFLKISVLKNFTIFAGKLLYLNLFYYKENPTQVFSNEYCDIFKNTFFSGHLRWLLPCSEKRK